MDRSAREIYNLQDSQDLSAIMLKAVYHIKNKNIEIAEYYLREALNSEAQHFWALQELANLALENGNLHEAVELYRQASIAAGPSEELRAYAECGLGRALFSMGDFESAENIYLQCISQFPSYIFSYTGLADVYESSDPLAIEKIIPLYEQAKQFAPDNKWINANLEKYKAQEFKFARNAPTAKNNSLQQGALLGRSSFSLCSEGRWEALFERECAQQVQNKTYRQKIITNKLKSLPRDAFQDLGAFYLFVAREIIQGMNLELSSALRMDLELAAACYFHVLEYNLNPSVDIYLETLELLHALGEYEKAESIILRALSLFPESPSLLLLAARIMEKCELYGEARFLYGEYAKTKSTAIDEDVLQEIVTVHGKASKAKAKKFRNLEEFLGGLVKEAKSNQAPSLVTAKEKRKIDGWLTEFFQLIGGFSIEHLFDIEHYQKQTKKWIASEEQAVIDYFVSGWNGAISVHPAIDDAFIRRQLVVQGKMNAAPLVLLYLRNENQLKLVPNAMVDPVRLHSQDTNVTGSAWLNFVTGKWPFNATSISPFFDSEYYLERTSSRDLEKLGSPLVNFLNKDSLSDCNRLFHTGYYIKRYDNLLNGKIPILHYLAEGAYLGCLPNPFCDLSSKSGQERIDYLKIS